MGQAWCKEKTSKAQDSKSPLDRVFVRCAHRIYPGLKEEGSVLGGATQRVTSSEIGYAGSPPREVLTRGRSIDSVDRPFHPSDWVDVNLEVPSTPRASSVLTNLTVDTGHYPATSPTSSCSNLKDATPIPPPRRRKRNRGRPLPPKPDEIPENITSNLKHVDTGDEPLYSSVKSPKTSGDEQDVEGETRGTSKSRSSTEGNKQTSEGKKKEVYEHKINGTGRIISSDIVSGKKASCEKRVSKTSEPSQHRRVHETEEYEKFARNQSIKDTSTPNRQDRRRSKDLEKQIENPPREGRSEVNARTKNYSTVSLPNYDELDVERHLMKRTKDEDGLEKTKSKMRPVRSSTGSLPAESFLSPFSEKTSVRLEDYIPRRNSIEHLSPYQVLERLDCSKNGVSGEGGFVKYDPSKLEDWDLSDISNCELNHRQHSCESSVVSEIGAGNFPGKRSCPARSEDVVDYSQDAETGEKEVIEKVSSFDGPDVPRGSTSLLQKPEAFGKTPSPVLELDKDSNLDGWIVKSNRSLRYFDPPTMSEVCKNSDTCDSKPTPFFLNEEKQRSVVDTIRGSCRNGAVQESDRSDQSRMIFGRSLSNESEPCDDSYESKELRAHSNVTASNLIRTISEESLPRDMLEDTREDFFGEKLAKDAHNKMKKDGSEMRIKTPPPSPEPKIKAEILDNDHSSLLKILKEEAEGSNLSSMTPSLTELEASLSDMLEKEEEKDEEENGYEKIPCHIAKSTEKPIEPKIVPIEKNSNAYQSDAKNVGNAKSEISGIGDKSLVERSQDNAEDKARGRKVSFCAWEESRMMEVELGNEKIGTCLLDNAPEKPGRLPKAFEENPLKHVDSCVPTPPRRKHKGSLGVLKEDDRNPQNGTLDELYHNDRLI